MLYHDTCKKLHLSQHNTNNMTKSERMRGIRRDRPSSPSPRLLPPLVPPAACIPILLLIYLLHPLLPSLHPSNDRACHALAATPYKGNDDKSRKLGGRPSSGGIKTKSYNYFAFGSNMASSTMTNLRNIEPISSTAAILPHHALRFNVPGMPYLEPAYASVEPLSSGDSGRSEIRDDDYDDDDDATARTSEHRSPFTNVHGVLYELSDVDFGKLCTTEGVPFVYALHRCTVYPYVGDGKSAGEEASRVASARLPRGGIPAFALRAADVRRRAEGTDISPSRSYLNVLLRGAREYALDESHVSYLGGIVCGTTLFGNGISEDMLRIAERRNRRRST